MSEDDKLFAFNLQSVFLNEKPIVSKLDVLKLFVIFGADLNKVDRNGNTPLKIAKAQGEDEIVEFLNRSPIIPLSINDDKIKFALNHNLYLSK